LNRDGLALERIAGRKDCASGAAGMGGNRLPRRHEVLGYCFMLRDLPPKNLLQNGGAQQ